MPVREWQRKSSGIPGVATELLPNATFRVKLENEHEIIAHTRAACARTESGLPDDKVLVEMTPYDLCEGRITDRFKHTVRSHARVPALRNSDT